MGEGLELMGAASRPSVAWACVQDYSKPLFPLLSLGLRGSHLLDPGNRFMDPLRRRMPVYAASAGRERACPARVWGTLTQTPSYLDQAGTPWEEWASTEVALYQPGSGLGSRSYRPKPSSTRWPH